MYVYILKCEDNSYYTGIAADPKKRLRQHLGIIKGGAKYTKIHKVMYIAALWEDKSGKCARKLEYQLKKMLRHDDKEKLIKNPNISFSEFGINVPSESFVYVNPQELNRQLNLNNE